MKVDFEMLERIVAQGASGEMILTMWKAYEAKRDVRRAVDRMRKGAENGGAKRKRAEKRTKTNADAAVDRDAATLADTPRARLFREAKPALLTLGISDSRAGGLVVQWLKLTNDDDQLVLATILKAQSDCVAEAPSWILATLRGKMNERSRNNPAADQSRSAPIIAGVAAAAERRFGGGGQPAVAEAAGTSSGPDPQFFGGR
ncbi:MAG TPA: hypothetical protein VJ846_12790 [Sphingomicrobium sp.]|nr:hypothetical protein [Sphingomicrobium sp.]